MEMQLWFRRNCFHCITLRAIDCLILGFSFPLCEKKNNCKKKSLFAHREFRVAPPRRPVCASKKVKSKGIYTWKSDPTRAAYLTANYSRISPNCSFSSPSAWTSRLTNARCFNGPPRSKTPGKIIQISSRRFSSNPGERKGSTHVDAQHTGKPRGLACQLTSPRASQIINRQLPTDRQQARKTNCKIEIPKCGRMCLKVKKKKRTNKHK